MSTAPISASQMSVEQTSDVCCSPINSNSHLFISPGGFETFEIWIGQVFKDRSGVFGNQLPNYVHSYERENQRPYPVPRSLSPPRS